MINILFNWSTVFSNGYPLRTIKLNTLVSQAGQAIENPNLLVSDMLETPDPVMPAISEASLANENSPTSGDNNSRPRIEDRPGIGLKFRNLNIIWWKSWQRNECSLGPATSHYTKEMNCDRWYIFPSKTGNWRNEQEYLVKLKYQIY